MGLIHIKMYHTLAQKNIEVLQTINRHEIRWQDERWKTMPSYLLLSSKTPIHVELIVATTLLVSAELENIANEKWEMLVVTKWIKFNGCRVMLKLSSVEFTIVCIMQ